MHGLSELVGTNVASCGVAEELFIEFGGTESAKHRLSIDSEIGIMASADDTEPTAPFADGADLRTLIGMEVTSVNVGSDSSLRVDFRSGVRLVVQGRAITPPWWLETEN